MALVDNDIGLVFVLLVVADILEEEKKVGNRGEERREWKGKSEISN